MIRSPTICALGSVNLDLIIQTKTLPRPGETITQGHYQALPGGKGANTALAAKRLGADVNLLAAVGQDDYASQALQLLIKADVDLSQLIEIDGTHTGLAFINVSNDGENQIAVASGANQALTPSHLPNIATDAIITQFEIPLETIIAAGARFDGFFSVNASPVFPGISPIIERADLIVVNEGEYQAYKDELKKYHGMLAITLGSKGAKLLDKGELIAQAMPPKINVVDTTGAGDSFVAALTVALIEKQSPQEALEFACTVGAITTTKVGAQMATPTRTEVDLFTQSSDDT